MRLSLASQLPSHLIIPPWRPHEAKLWLQAGTWAVFPACELALRIKGAPRIQPPPRVQLLWALGKPGHTAKTWIKKEIVDKMVHFPTGAASCIIVLHIKDAVMLEIKHSCETAAEAVCVSLCLRQPAWLGARHPDRSCWRGKQDFQTF